MVAKEPEHSDEQFRDRGSPIRKGLTEIGNKWCLIVLYDLQEGEKRFNEIKRSTGINPATLSRTLDDLQNHGLITRREHETQVATFYSLTEKGKSLRTVFETLHEQAAKYDWK